MVLKLKVFFFFFFPSGMGLVFWGGRGVFVVVLFCFVS